MLKCAFVFMVVTTAFSVASAERGMIADVSLTPAGDFKAETEEVVGEALQKGDMVVAENVIVKLRNLKTGKAVRDKHTKEKYLEIEKYPEAILLKATGKGGKGKGRLKFHGVEKDIEGTYKVEGQELISEFLIKLSDFGINKIKYMGVGVDDEVKLHVTLPLKQK